MNNLLQYPSVVIRQRRELAELLGFETRNKYEILDGVNGKLLFYCAERQKGILGFLMRQFLGHWRSFELHFFDPQKQLLWKAVHPFRFIFQRLDVFAGEKELGSVEWKWGIFRKRYLLSTPQNPEQMKIESGFLSFWTFPLTRGGNEVGKIQKKWSGLLKEVFTDTDNFLVEFSPGLSEQERALVLSAAILVDLTYFEHKG